MSSPAAGDFSCSALLNIQAQASAIFSPSAQTPDITPYAVAATAVAANQTANFEVLQNPKKDREVTVTWVQDCDTGTEDCSTICDLTGPEGGSQCQDYTLGKCIQKGFEEPRHKYRTNVLDPEQVIAHRLAVKLKAMDEALASYVVTKLLTFAGVNNEPSPYTYDAGTKATYLPAASWTPDTMAYLALVRVLNKLNSLYMLSGKQLWTTEFRAMMNQGNADGKGDAQMMQTFRKYWDPFNIEAQQAGGLFLIDPNSVALVSKVYYPADVPEYIGGQVGHWRSSIASPSIPGVRYDLIKGLVCKNNDYYDQYRLLFTGDVFLNPQGCDEGRTGVLLFICGVAP